MLLTPLMQAVKEKEDRDHAELGKKQKFIFFICGMFAVPLLLAYLDIWSRKDERGKKRTKESLKWLWRGMATMFLLAVILNILKKI